MHLDSLAFWRPDQSIERARDVASSMLASAVRGYSGSAVGRLGQRPRETLLLFEREPCPYSRLVREALSILDLDAEVHPCPKGELAHRAELKLRGGKAQIPFLVDPNTGEQRYESRAIVEYLFATYGTGPAPRSLTSRVAVRRSRVASRLRARLGERKQPARRPSKPLELYGYEAEPHTRIVREQLSTLALPWMCRNRARGSLRRAGLAHELDGPITLPLLVDPNTGRTVAESDIICAYLVVTYGR